jgi:hypothetical protein
VSELLTVSEVAAILKESPDAVTRRFAKVPGVIDLGRAETRDKRQYRVLRIPKAVVEKYLSQKAGHPVKIEVPPRPERRRKSDGWEDRAVLNLAKAALQNHCEDPAVIRGIAEKARLLVGPGWPEERRLTESQWVEVLASWTEEE